ncbi:pseudouridine-5'-phosphatase-like [Sycon ciliatum]|uniref:pseudouridine-5'-phosphatase-like n=1 Tax=Sycon ciliatum TaxID=27933 RepID=UPI0020A8873F|eukprot:scpid16494/ scgid13108/ Pseudouridine-5&apos; Haloacid dehalogenase-like hydrolase domain-containing protein 1; Haloacid dehalogenase-like hydrolase domain-containing protein 1A; Protein GS1
MAESTKPKITHVIFDMDGLLLDTESIYTLTTQEQVSRYGKDFTWEVKGKLMGTSEREGWQILFRELELEGKADMEEMMIQTRKRRDELFPTCKLMPGAERLIRHLHSHGVPICVATSSRSSSFEAKTSQKQELFSLFHHCVRGDDPDLKRAKPSPDIFLVAASRFSEPPAPEKCLVFEDAPQGVEAALAANMTCIMVPDSHLSKSLLGRAHVELASLEDFDPAVYGLPGF